METIPELSFEYDEAACYNTLVELLHPGGLACPRCHARDGLGIHRRRRAPVLDYQCGSCGRVFNAWTGTILQGRQRRPSQILRILRGISQGMPTARLARELSCSRGKLIDLRRRLRDHAGLRSRMPDDGDHQQNGEPDPVASKPAEAPPATRSDPSTGATGPVRFGPREAGPRPWQDEAPASEWIRLGRRLCAMSSS